MRRPIKWAVPAVFLALPACNHGPEGDPAVALGRVTRSSLVDSDREHFGSEDSHAVLRAHALVRRFGSFSDPVRHALKDVLTVARRQVQRSGWKAEPIDWLERQGEGVQRRAVSWAQAQLREIAERAGIAAARESIRAAADVEAELHVLLADLRGSLSAELADELPRDALGLLAPDELRELRSSIQPALRRLRRLRAAFPARQGVTEGIAALETLEVRLGTAEGASRQMRPRIEEVLSKVDRGKFAASHAGRQARVAHFRTLLLKRIGAGHPALAKRLAVIDAIRGPPAKSVDAIVFAACRHYDSDALAWGHAEARLQAMAERARQLADLPAPLRAMRGDSGFGRSVALALVSDRELVRLSRLLDGLVPDSNQDPSTVRRDLYFGDWQHRVSRERQRRKNPRRKSLRSLRGQSRDLVGLRAQKLPADAQLKLAAIIQDRFPTTGQMPHACQAEVRRIVERGYRKLLSDVKRVEKLSDTRWKQAEKQKFDRELARAKSELADAVWDAERRGVVDAGFARRVRKFRRNKPTRGPPRVVLPSHPSISKALENASGVAEKAESERRSRARVARRRRRPRRSAPPRGGGPDDLQKMLEDLGFGSRRSGSKPRGRIVGFTKDGQAVRDVGYGTHPLRIGNRSTPYRRLSNGVL